MKKKVIVRVGSVKYSIRCNIKDVEIEHQTPLWFFPFLFFLTSVIISLFIWLINGEGYFIWIGGVLGSILAHYIYGYSSSVLRGKRKILTMLLSYNRQGNPDGIEGSSIIQDHSILFIEKRRKLILILFGLYIAGIISMILLGIILPFSFKEIFPGISTWIAALLLLLAVLNTFFIYIVYQQKKIGLYGLVACSAVNILIFLSIRAEYYSIVGLLITPIFIYLIIRPIWNKFA